MKVYSNRINYQAESPSKFCRVGPFDKLRNKAVTGVVSRNDFLFAAGAIAVISGLLFPVSTHILDVLLIFSISLTIATLVITFSISPLMSFDRKIWGQVQGFPLLIVLVTMLHIALNVASTKLLSSRGSAGTIIGLFGGIFVGGNHALAILIFGTLVMVIFGAICKAVKGIIQTGTQFISDIIPVKQINVDSELKAGIINESQALELQRGFACQSGFFAAMTGTGRFIFCGAIIGSIVAVINIVASMAVGTVGSGPGFATYYKTTAPLITQAISAKTYLASTVGAGMIIQISALLTAIACIYLVRRSYVYSAVDNVTSEEEFAERIEIVTSRASITDSQSSLRQSSITARAEDGTNEIVLAEWFDESQHIEDENEQDDLSLWVEEKIKDNDSYEAVTELLESKSNEAVGAKTVLMAAETVKELGVTIPVNVAIRLAQRGKKCLLIDLDSERNAISKVFDIDLQRSLRGFGDKSIPQVELLSTCISNLWIWPVSWFSGIGKDDSDTDSIDIKQIITNLESQYDRLIIYAPNLAGPASIQWEKINGCVKTAMLFGSRESSKNSGIEDLQRVFGDSGCEILKPTEVFAQSV